MGHTIAEETMNQKEINLKISGMHCASCEKLVSLKLEKLPGAENISIDSKTGTGYLKVDEKVEDSTIINAVKQTGYDSSIV